MKLSGIFTKRRLGLDRSIWLTMMVVCVLSIGLAGYKIIGEKPCPAHIPVAISSNNNSKNNVFFVGEAIRFAAPMEGSQQVIWNFGDRTPQIQGMRVTHTYSTDGQFLITVTVNGRCVENQTVMIKKLRETAGIDSSNALIQALSNPINGNFTPEQGRQTTYTSAVPASSYEWSVVDEINMPKMTTPTCTYTFQAKKQYKLKLVLNADPQKTYYKDIIVTALTIPDVPVTGGGMQTTPSNILLPPVAPPVLPRKEDPVTNHNLPPVTNTDNKPPANDPPAGKKTIGMSPEGWKSDLQEVVEGRKPLAEFDDYICDLQSDIVYLNKDDKKISFIKLFQIMNNNKRIKSETITVDRVYNSKTNCLEALSVKYEEKKKFLGLGKN